MKNLIYVVCKDRIPQTAYFTQAEADEFISTQLGDWTICPTPFQLEVTIAPPATNTLHPEDGLYGRIIRR